MPDAPLQWMEWLRDTWLPLQDSESSLAEQGKEALQEATCNARTNQLLAQHCAPNWSHPFLNRLKAVLTGAQYNPAPPPATCAAIEQCIGGDEQVRRQIVRDIDAVLSVMDEVVVKQWLCKHTVDAQGKPMADYPQ